MKKGGWTFLTSHGMMLIYITRHPQSTTEEIAHEVGVTLRTVQKIISDLEAEGYIKRLKKGRCNNYIVNPELPMRHRLVQEFAIGDVLSALGYNSLSDNKFII
jgi:Mn-dependent DtxR family transcriptional regulator